MKYLSVIGTRPQYMKVLTDLEDHAIFDVGQHYSENMSDVFIKDLKLDVIKGSSTDIGEITDECVAIIEEHQPQIVIVYGDTRTTLGASVAAKLCDTTLAHVEAGMRSWDRSQPEEVSRVVADKLADMRFCTHEMAIQNLIHEGLTEGNFLVGDPLWDSLSRVLPLKPRYKAPYHLLTIHRAQNANLPFVQNVLNGLRADGTKTYWPVHPRMNALFSGLDVPRNVKLLDPQPYREMVRLEVGADKILTDSGGVQREAYWFAKPCLILRNETEWQFIVDEGWGVLVGSNPNRINQALTHLNPHVLRNPRKSVPEVGAKDRIAQILRG